jgi:hypothetical protein
MKILYRQGIVRNQVDMAGTATFVRKNGSDSSYIDLVCDNGPCVFTCAHSTADYLVEELKTVARAWGPITGSGVTQYLYWDISLLDGTVSRGFTSVHPFTGTNAPNAPVNDQHWFDITTNLMKVWNGSKWLTKIRLFAATYSNNGILIPNARGSQVNLNVSVEAGNILFGKNSYPLRDSDGTFVTTESSLIVGKSSGENVRFDAAQLTFEALENIPKYSLISYISPRKAQLSSYNNINLLINGIVTQDYYIGEVGNVISYGLVSNDQWSFTSSDINKPLFCGIHGEVTLTPPQVGVSQRIGYVYDLDTIYLSILQPIIM